MRMSDPEIEEWRNYKIPGKEAIVCFKLFGDNLAEKTFMRIIPRGEVIGQVSDILENGKIAGIELKLSLVDLPEILKFCEQDKETSNDSKKA